MTKLVKKLLISLMAIAMTACLGYALLGTQPITANAATAEYGLWVGGVKVTSDNLVIDGNDNSTITGSATYDAENNILTLDNFSYTGAGYLFDDWIGNSAIIFAENELTVKLVGTNVITTTEDRCFGIVSYGLLTITDDTEDKTDGVLTITCEFCAINVGTLSICNVTVNATGLGAICVEDGDTIINNAIINAIGTSEEALLVNDIFKVENSSLTLESQVGIALDCYDSIDSFYTIKNSTLTINSQNKGIRGAEIFVSNSTIEISAVNEAVCDSILGVGYALLFIDSHEVYAGVDSASATLIAEPDDTTYENKYVKVVPTYDVWVAGIRLNAENFIIDREDDASISGSATYDAVSNTLTLDNFVYSGEGYLKANGDYVAIYVADGTTIKAVGENDIYCNGSYDKNYIAIYSEGELTIIGGGSVTDTLKVKSYWGSGIYSENTINFENLNATIIAECGDGVFVNKSYGDVYIKNSNLVVKAYNKGFSLNYAVVIFENSIVAIYSEDEYALWDRSFGGNVNRPNYSDSDGDGYRDKHFAFAGIDEEHSFEVDAEDINTFKEYYVIVIPSRKITLDLSAAGQANKEVFAMLGGTIIIDTPTVADYVFVGWYNENTFETLFDFSAPITENITIYAKFANYTSDIENINGQISSVQSTIITLENNLANKADATELANNVTDLQGKIDALTNNYQSADATQQN